jgi:hypothetical protein
MRTSRRERYAINVQVDFELQGTPIEIGHGRLVNISTTGILIDTQRKTRPGVKARVAVPWPARLNGEVALVLHIRGETIRADGNLVAVRISRAEFRTRGAGSRLRPTTTIGGSAS